MAVSHVKSKLISFTQNFIVSPKNKDCNQDIDIQTKPSSRKGKNNIEIVTINTVDYDL